MFTQIRNIDFSKKVSIYRNLHKKCYSIKQNNRVVAYADEIYLSEVELKVSQSGRLRVLKEKRKNVHATLHGYITNNSKILTQKLYYNPYKTEYFIDLHTQQPIHNAKLVHCLSDMTLSYE